MEIREAVRGDIPRLVLLGEEFALLSQPFHGFSVSRTRIIEFTNQVVENPGCVVLVLIDENVIQGFIAGVMQRIYFSEDVALQELAWYVRQGFKGLALMEHFQRAAQVKNCTKLIVGNKPQYCDFQIFYERHNFKLLEHQYVKNI